jgi:hypothetical protein
MNGMLCSGRQTVLTYLRYWIANPPPTSTYPFYSKSALLSPKTSHPEAVLRILHTGWLPVRGMRRPSPHLPISRHFVPSTIVAARHEYRESKGSSRSGHVLLWNPRHVTFSDAPPANAIGPENLLGPEKGADV